MENNEIGWRALCSAEDIPAEGIVARVIAGKRLALFRHEDGIEAVLDRCPHMDFPLSQGILREGKLICTLHHWEFPVGGPDPDMPPEQQLCRFPCRVVEGVVQVQLG